LARKSNKEILAALRTEPDGLVTRNVGLWTLEKLGILLLYAQAFTRASKKASGGYYVDGLAGTGICRVKETGHFVLGSALVALQTTPRFRRCILLEKGLRNYNALSERADSYGERASVQRGDVNEDLPRIIQQEVPNWAPCFCLLDPEGTELRWSTIRSIARTPGRKRKPELLILFPLQMGLLRLMTVIGPMPSHFRMLINEAFGTSDWSAVHRARLNGSVSPADAKERYTALYCQQLDSLGYRHTEARLISAQSRAGRPRQERYYLVFATDHAGGANIMNDVFKRWYSLDPEQPTLFE
jgi:three-Cys-motif partner protein